MLILRSKSGNSLKPSTLKKMAWAEEEVSSMAGYSKICLHGAFTGDACVAPSSPVNVVSWIGSGDAATSSSAAATTTTTSNDWGTCMCAGEFSVPCSDHNAAAVASFGLPSVTIAGKAAVPAAGAAFDAAAGPPLRALCVNGTSDAVLTDLPDLLSLEAVADLFNGHDSDGNGALDSGEILSALRGFGLGLSDSELDELAAGADVDGDGQVGMSDFANMASDLSDFSSCSARLLSLRLDTIGKGFECRPPSSVAAGDVDPPPEARYVRPLMPFGGPLKRGDDDEEKVGALCVARCERLVYTIRCGMIDW